MRALTKSEAKQWCVENQIALNECGYPQLEFAEERGRDFHIPWDAAQRIVLLRKLFSSWPVDQETLVWITGWSVWESGERMHMFERFRSSYGENRPLIESPAFLFSGAEIEDVISFAGFAILFLWDCHVLTASGDTWLFVSHDEIGWLCSRLLPPGSEDL